MSEPFQPTRPLPTNWLELERYARELEARLSTTAGNVVELETRIAAHEPASLEWTRVVRAATDDGPHAMPLETDVADWVREMRARLEATTAGNVVELEARIAELEKRPCPNVVTSAEGTAYCRLAEDEGRNLRWARDQALKKTEEVSKNAAKEIAAVTRENSAMIDEVIELRRQLEAAEQQRDENRESSFALAAHANEKIKRLREALTMIMAAPAYCSCSPESGCKSAVAREAARAALAATESPASGEAGESEVGRG